MPLINDSILVNDWHVALRADDLPPETPVSVTVLGETLVLWRDDETVHTWKDLCIHRGARLSLGRVAGGCLICPYHGWTYGTDGACVKIPSQPDRAIPAKAQAFTYHAQVHLGWVWVCLGTPSAPPPPFPEGTDPRFRTVPCGPYRFRALGPRAIENFLDVAHLPFVHDGTLGEADHTRLQDYEARTTPNGVIAEDIAVWQPDPDGRGQGAYVHYTYEVLRPLTARLRKGFEGSHFALLFAVTPRDDDYCDGWALIAMNYETPQTDAEIRAFEDKIMGEDKPIIESQRPDFPKHSLTASAR